MALLELQLISNEDTDITRDMHSSRGEEMVQSTLQKSNKEAETIHKTLSLSVRSFNQSLGLFARLGFAQADESGAPLPNNSINKES